MYGGSENPHDVNEHEHGSLKINVLCFLMRNKVIDLFFFHRLCGDWWRFSVMRSLLCVISLQKQFSG